MTAKEPSYELIYWPGFPGRGEQIRLAFVITNTEFKDVCNDDQAGIEELKNLIFSDNSTLFAPPLLRVSGDLTIHQLPNILIYLAGKLGLEGDNEAQTLAVRQIMLTALDLNNETHDTHHPVAVMEYYEDQKAEALRKSIDFRKNRLPKFFGYFSRILKANQSGQGKYLVGDKVSIADIALWQVLDGLRYAFPKEMEVREKEYSILFDVFYSSFKEQAYVNEYLSSKRRQPYSSGIFRRYPELDRQ